MITAINQGNQPANQFISFVEGSASAPPDPSSFPLQVLGVDHDLNTISGGDPTDGFSPWVTDILVYPSSEYWETLLSNDRVRPYVDFSISQYNTLRIPSAVHNYDLYVDEARIYENCVIDGDLTVKGNFDLGEAEVSQIVSQNFGISPEGNITGTANTKVPVTELTEDTTLDVSKTGHIFQCKPTASNMEITLPTGEDGIIFTLMNCLPQKTVKINGINAIGDTLVAQYASATVYWGGDAWYGFGNLG